MRTDGIRSERGGMMVLFALVLPLIFVASALAVDVGNWYVHYRRAQTQVDAGALAGGGKFQECFFDTGAGDASIAAEALNYAGDRNRVSTTYNQQVQQPADVHVRLNSTDFWPAGGDNTILVDNPANPGSYVNGTPCVAKFIDVKATDDDLPLLFGFIPFVPDAKTKARVELQRIESQEGILPWAVPDVDPQAVAVLLVDHAQPEDVVDSVALSKVGTQPISGQSLVLWQGVDVSADINREATGAVVLLSTQPNPDLDASKSLTTLCTQANTACYPGLFSGLGFIYGHDTGTGSAANPSIQDVQISSTCLGDDAAPYFVLNGPCESQRTTDPDQFNVVVNAGSDTVDDVKLVAPGCGGNGCVLVKRTVSGTQYWTLKNGDTISIDSGTGINNLTLVVDATPSGGGKKITTTRLVARAYGADDSSGPIEFFDISDNSVLRGNRALTFDVGLRPNLKLATTWDETPINLRKGSDSGSINQGLDCDRRGNPAPFNTIDPRFDEEIRDGCFTKYVINASGGACPADNQITYPANLPLYCVLTEQGDRVGLFERGIEDRLTLTAGTQCPTNHWRQPLGTPSSQLPVIQDGDPRLVPLIVTDSSAFFRAQAQDKGKPPAQQGRHYLPVRAIAGFYITGWDGAPTNCSENVPPPPRPKKNNKGDAWGHFVKYVPQSSGGTGTGEICNFQELGNCIPVLVD